MRRFAWILSAGLALWGAAASAETVVRYGISMSDIPLTAGQPDRGAGAYQFTGYTIYDPLIAWEMNVADRPGKLVPGLATEWSVDPSDPKKCASRSAATSSSMTAAPSTPMPSSGTSTRC